MSEPPVGTVDVSKEKPNSGLNITVKREHVSTSSSEPGSLHSDKKRKVAHIPCSPIATSFDTKENEKEIEHNIGSSYSSIYSNIINETENPVFASSHCS